MKKGLGARVNSAEPVSADVWTAGAGWRREADRGPSGKAGVLKTKAQNRRRLLTMAEGKEQKKLLTRDGLRTKRTARRESNSWPGTW